MEDDFSLIRFQLGNQVSTYGVSFHGDKDFRSTITDECIVWRYANSLIKQCMGGRFVPTTFDSLKKKITSKS
jgi:hypothetical protein